jgi:hypothetical protein
MMQLTVRSILNVLDLEPRAASHFVSEGLLNGLCIRFQRVSDMELAEQCVKWYGMPWFTLRCLQVLFLFTSVPRPPVWSSFRKSGSGTCCDLVV